MLLKWADRRVQRERGMAKFFCCLQEIVQKMKGEEREMADQSRQSKKTSTIYFFKKGVSKLFKFNHSSSSSMSSKSSGIARLRRQPSKEKVVANSTISTSSSTASKTNGTAKTTMENDLVTQMPFPSSTSTSSSLRRSSSSSSSSHKLHVVNFGVDGSEILVINLPSSLSSSSCSPLLVEVQTFRLSSSSHRFEVQSSTKDLLESRSEEVHFLTAKNVLDHALGM
jgi:hypothetical protein